jgi:hypothetical protein
MLKYCLLCTLVVTCAAFSQTRTGAKTGTRSVFEADSRLDRSLTVRAEVIPLARVVPEIHKQLGVDIMIQGEMLRRTVTIQQAGRPARELLADVGLLLGGTWIKRDDAYLLLTDDVTAGLVKRWNGRQAVRESQALVLSLTRDQLRLLENGQNIKYEQLLPTQQRLVRTIATEAFLENPQRYPSSVVTGEGFLIAKPQVSDPPCLSFLAPTVWEDGRVRGGDMGSVVLRDLPR